MRGLIRIVFMFVALLYLGGMVYQVGYFTYFKINQDEIAAEFCVNKEKPEMHCNGQCHLNKELEKAQVFDKDDQSQKEQDRLPQINLEILLAIFPDHQADLSISISQLYVLAWRGDDELRYGNPKGFWHPPQV